MEESASGENQWTMNVDEVFENFSNVRRWNDNDLYGLIFGAVSTGHIASVLFSSEANIASATKHITFAESSFSAGISFIGLLILKDVEYKFEVENLADAIKDTKAGLVIYTDTGILKNKDVDGFLQSCQPLLVRNSNSGPAVGFTAMVTMQLDLHLKFNEPDTFKEMLQTAVSDEIESLDTLCFFNPDHSLLLGFKNSMSDISALLKNERTPFFEDIVEFVPLRPVSAENGDEQKLVPVVRISKGLESYAFLRNTVKAFAIITTNDSAHDLVQKLRIALSRALYLAAQCIEDYSNLTKEVFVDINSCGFLIGNNLICVCYPQLDDEPTLNKPLGEVSLVKGSYDYHHYLQEGYDDCGWGCAYRSFQTIWSWFNHQGFTEKPVPSHKEIQQSLVDCGDKGPKFVGSKQWIGSTELGFCLENMLGIQSRIIATNSGTEVAENARQLAVHFKNVGTPVMIGGGMLAHTILGVDFNESSGESAFLVLDPHYPGEDVFQIVISKGWCGWKPPNFWKAEHFYNLLLPLAPTNVI